MGASVQVSRIQSDLVSTHNLGTFLMLCKSAKFIETRLPGSRWNNMTDLRRTTSGKPTRFGQDHEQQVTLYALWEEEPLFKQANQKESLLGISLNVKFVEGQVPQGESR